MECNKKFSIYEISDFSNCRIVEIKKLKDI